MSAETTSPGFLSLKDMLPFLDYGAVGFAALGLILFAFLIFVIMAKKSVKPETMKLLDRLIFLTVLFAGVIFGLSYFENRSILGKAQGEIDETEERIQALTKEIDLLQVRGYSSDTIARLEQARGALDIKLNELKRLTGQATAPTLLKDQTPYTDMRTPDRLIEIAKTRLGTKWAFGKRAQLQNAGYGGPWDNSEFMGWVVYQATGEVIGCEPPDPGLADCYTGFWGGEPGPHGTEQSVAWGLASKGGILVRLPAPNAGRVGKVGISLGDGRFIESNGQNEVVQISDPQDAEYWDFAVQLN
ncbi:MAG: hypothetical protein AAF638_04980 [Pseudomonadota bacterium]